MTNISYNVSKAALNRMVEHVQNDHAKDGLVAFTVHPGASLTSQIEGLNESEAEVLRNCEFASPGLDGGEIRKAIFCY